MSKDEKKAKKATSLVIEGIEFSLPFKTKKDRFVKIYGDHFKDRTEAHFDTLSKAK